MGDFSGRITEDRKGEDSLKKNYYKFTEYNEPKGKMLFFDKELPMVESVPGLKENIFMAVERKSALKKEKKKRK